MLTAPSPGALPNTLSKKLALPVALASTILPPYKCRGFRYSLLSAHTLCPTISGTVSQSSQLTPASCKSLERFTVFNPSPASLRLEESLKISQAISKPVEGHSNFSISFKATSQYQRMTTFHICPFSHLFTSQTFEIWTLFHNFGTFSSLLFHRLIHFSVSVESFGPACGSLLLQFHLGSTFLYNSSGLYKYTISTYSPIFRLHRHILLASDFTSISTNHVYSPQCHHGPDTPQPTTHPSPDP